MLCKHDSFGVGSANPPKHAPLRKKSNAISTLERSRDLYEIAKVSGDPLRPWPASYAGDFADRPVPGSRRARGAPTAERGERTRGY